MPHPQSARVSRAVQEAPGGPRPALGTIACERKDRGPSPAGVMLPMQVESESAAELIECASPGVDGKEAEPEAPLSEEERTERALQALYAAPSEDDDDFYIPLLLD